ncbi:Ribonuclease P protein subunit p25-like protein [Dirofilaria immitis]
MDNYVKESEISIPCSPPFPTELTTDIKEMIVKENTKFKNILTFVDKLFEDANCRMVIFKGVGEATAKCISCVEVFKRNYKNGTLYQWNKIVFTRRTDSWSPTTDNLNKLLVHVDVPTIYILISRDPFPENFIDERIHLLKQQDLHVLLGQCQTGQDHDQKNQSFGKDQDRIGGIDHRKKILK